VLIRVISGMKLLTTKFTKSAQRTQSILSVKISRICVISVPKILTTDSTD